MNKNDDIRLKQKREELRKKLLNSEFISINKSLDNYETKELFQIEVKDDYGNSLFVSEPGNDLQLLLIPHVSIIIDNEEIPLLKIKNRLIDDRINKSCSLICAIIRTSSYFWSSQFHYEETPSFNDILNVSDYLLGSNSNGERVKLRIGSKIIKATDIGRTIIKDNLSVIVYIIPRTEIYGPVNNTFMVLQSIERYLISRSECMMSIPTNWKYVHWGVGTL